MKPSPLVHPGMILRHEFFKPRRITESAVAKTTGIPRSRLSEILSGRRPLTADVAARLGRFFEVDPRNWLNLQATYDLRENGLSVHPEHKKILGARWSAYKAGKVSRLSSTELKRRLGAR